MEGVADRRSAGHIAVDNIQILDGLSAEDCKGVYCVIMYWSEKLSGQECVFLVSQFIKCVLFAFHHLLCFD